MKNRASYSYAILRYVHDIATGEFINAGVVVMSPHSEFVKFRFRTSVGRVSDLFPDIKPHQFRRTIRAVQKRCEEVANTWLSPLRLEARTNTLADLLKSVLPKDDSSLVWANSSVGLSSDLEATLSSLYEKYVSKYDRPRYKSGRTDDDVWKTVHKNLTDRRMLGFFSEKTIEGKSDDVKFDFAWKNGIWHCIEPLSFDLNAAESIREKAHRCAGEIVGISDSKDHFKIYLVVGKPTHKDLVPAYERAIGILQNTPHAEVYSEDEHAVLLDKLDVQIAEHERHLRH